MWKRIGCMSGSLLLLPRMPPIAEDFQNNQAGADDDGGIREVKGVPVEAADVEIDEVGDAAAQESVEDISCGTAENHAEAALAEPAAGTVCGQQPNEQRDHRSRKSDQHRCEPGRS